MAEEEIIIKYKVDTTDFKQVGTAVDNVTEKIEDMGHTAKAAFSEAQIEQVTRELYEQGKVIEALIVKHGNAKKAMGEVNKELQTMALLGKQGTKEFKELEKVAAELTDTIGDTRDAVKRLASDTRTIDLVAQGVRGIAAGMSVATGAAALFGKENEDLQKAILKVQGALATMQGVQELATLATEKGGIATVAYGAALKGVEAISKTFGISMAASWAVATAGLSVLVAGVVALISYLDGAKSASERLAQAEKDRQNEFLSKYKSQIDALDELKQRQENEHKLAQIRGEDLIKLEKRQLNERLALITQLQYEVKYNRETNAIDEAAYKELSTRLERERLDTLLALRKDNAEKTVKVKKEQREKEFEIDAQKFDFPKPPKMSLEVTKLEIKPDKVEITKVPNVPLPVNIQPLSTEEKVQKFANELANNLQKVLPTVLDLQQLQSNIFSIQTRQLQEEKDKQLAIAGDNLKKREKIEKDFAIKQARLARQQAITNKVFGIFQATVSMSIAIAKAIEKGFPAAIADVALAGAIGASQIAAIASQPLPEVPKFEKGGEVKRKGARALLGGAIRPDNMIIGRSHREGGVLIEAQGGEVINHVAASAKYRDELKAANEMKLESLIAHKYIAPAIENERRKSKATKLVVNNDYDDALLRKTIRDTSAANAHFVAKEVSKTVTDTLYFKQRYQ